MNLSTNPPQRVTQSHSGPRQPAIRSRTASASSSSVSGVKPDRSANRTVTIRRSACPTDAMCAPQVEQNWALARFSSRQAGHAMPSARSTGVPQPAQ